MAPYFSIQTTGAAEVEQAFPEALKGPVLRRVQFSTVSRIDALVDGIYDDFRSDYYPGEHVIITGSNGNRLQGVVRDKTRFGAKVQPDATLIPPYTRYVVQLENTGEDLMVEESNICRDRKLFTKAVLRSFIKKMVGRETWNGAPWLIKNNDAAEIYGVDTRVPDELQYSHKIQERKQQQMLKKTEQNQACDPLGPARLPNLKPLSKKGKEPFLDPSAGRLKDQHRQFPVSFRPAEYLRLPLPPSKYPIEDLQVPPRDRPSRPLLRYWCKDPPVELEESIKKKLPQDIIMSSVGPLLECWDTLNVYCEIFILDSFTFDDFVEAMQIASADIEVQLFDEMHCAILKTIVNEQGNTEVSLPETDEHKIGGEEDRKPTPEPEPRITRTTRRSLAKMEAERLAVEVAAAKKNEKPEPKNNHCGSDFGQAFDWIGELSKRHFKDGGWQAIVAGLLYRLSFKQRLKKSCDELLTQLAPPDLEPTRESIKKRYLGMDINWRIRILEILCMLTMETKAIRGYMDECSATMTSYRKEKIEWQRQRKDALEELKSLQDQRRALAPEPHLLPSEGTKVELKEDGKTTDAEESIMDHTMTDDSNDDVHEDHGLRRGHSRAVERRRKWEEEQGRRARDLAAKHSKQPKQLIKVLKEIQKKEGIIKKCSEEIATLDNDLREADCPRTRVLGKDRFWNRYYWFERNGMPYGGLPSSSTAQAAYANGMVWVQGPDELERKGFLEGNEKYQAEYMARFNMTVHERKRKEEGATSVYNAWQWGYYSAPQEVDALIKWLDARGCNEMRLRKELIVFRERIQKNMNNRKAYISPDNGDKEEHNQLSRRATRGRAQWTLDSITYKCQAWINNMALSELGHLHSEPPPPPRKKQRRR